MSKNLKVEKPEEQAFFILCAFKLDGVGRVDNRPLKKMWHDSWQVGGGEPSLKMSAP